MPDFSVLYSFSDGELSALVDAVHAEIELRGRVKVHLDWVVEHTGKLESIAGEIGVKPFEPVPHFGHIPGAIIEWEGEQWRNTSGAALTNHPGEAPERWQQLTGLPEDVDEWVPGVEVTAGEIWAYQDQLYRAVQSHTTQAGWEPPNLPALWVIVGESDE